MSREAAELVRQRFETALELADLAAELAECRIRREHPASTEADVQQRLAAWYAARPGALHGDGEGDPVPWPRR